MPINREVTRLSLLLYTNTSFIQILLALLSHGHDYAVGKLITFSNLT